MDWLISKNGRYFKIVHGYTREYVTRYLDALRSRDSANVYTAERMSNRWEGI